MDITRLTSKEASPYWARGLFWLGLVAVMSAALVTQLTGFALAPIWIDEAWRANLMLSPNWLSELFSGSAFAQITSPVYFVLNRLINVFGSNEVLLRLTSLIPALVSVLLIALIGAKLTKSRILGLLAGLMAALNPQFYYYAKEFKPYALELMTHMGLVLIALTYVARVEQKKTISPFFKIVVASVAPLATLTAANSIFILPGYYAVIAYAEWRADKRLTLHTMISVAVAMALVVSQYLLIWGRNTGDLLNVWSVNFPPAEGDRLTWLFKQLMDMVHVSFVTLPSRWFHSVMATPLLKGETAELLLGGLIVVGIISGLVRWRKPEGFLLVALPMIGVLLANQLQIWPLGGIRPNIFAFGYLQVLAIMGVGFLTSWSVWARAAASLPLLLWLGLWSFPDDYKGFRDQAPGPQRIPSAMAAAANDVGQHCADQELVMVGRGIGPSVQYYMNHHISVRANAGDKLKRCAVIYNMAAEADHPDVFGAEVQAVLAERNARSAWYLWSHLGEAEVASLRKTLAESGELVFDRDFGRAGAIHLMVATPASSKSPVETSPPAISTPP